MNKKLLLIVAVTLALMVSLIGPATVAAQPPEMVKVLIGFDRQPGSDEEGIVRGAGGAIKYTYHLVPAIAASVPEAAIEGLSRNPRVTSVEPDIDVYAIDAELDNAWGVKHIGAGTVHGYNKGTGVKVAVIDTGIDWNHPDLNANYKGGYDFVNSDTDPMDDNGHGTHVAGIGAAEDDDSGVVGVAPEAAVYALKVLDADGSGSYSDVIAALQWAVDNGIRVTNNSYGSRGDPGETVKAAFDNAYAAGVLHVAAAGNSGNRWGFGDNVIYPARYDSVIAVAATDKSDARASWSSTGSTVELAAPGVDVYSTYWDDTYATKSGTSMASPHVAGTAALVMVTYPGWTNVQVRSQLQDTADDLGAAGKDNLYGYGLVDANEAAPSTNALPSVAITDPADGVTISGTYRVKVSASDSDGTIAMVELSIDSASYIDITANFDGTSYYYDWNTTAVADGSYTLDARATDDLGATTNANQVAVTVDNVDEPPTVSITRPASGAFVSGIITIEASASDDTGVSKVDFYIDEALLATDDTAPYECSWDTTTVADGSHSIKVVATDTTNQTASDTITVAVDNTTPLVDVVEPVEGAIVSGTISIKASVEEANIDKVEYQIDSGSFATMTYDSSSGYWEASWDTTTVTNDSHTVTVRAIDKAGNSGSDSNTVTVNNPVNTMHIASIDMSTETIGRGPWSWTKAIAVVTVVDASGNPVDGATADGHWSGLTNGAVSATTDASGKVRFESKWVKNASGTFTFTVDNVELSGWSYDSAANVETSDSVTVP